MGGPDPCANSKTTPVTCKRAWVKPWSEEQMDRVPRKTTPTACKRGWGGLRRDVQGDRGRLRPWA
eukprot:8385387-Alexandrium_andersonii.AAC.1